MNRDRRPTGLGLDCDRQNPWVMLSRRRAETRQTPSWAAPFHAVCLA
ncbi:hypothetical protein FRUB_08603 [Fimbriiglobus ruber]|uniref:Uncharacterized protein n=1 Tax=Fimbriiglobus ruber TaxID=1908690 RepID=A0A225D375_9BACT|nr:hypothetical protein FRUB_08603 [Fimbriiglobus ruber]